MKVSQWLKKHVPEAYEPFIRALGDKIEKDVRSPKFGFNQFKYKNTKEGKRYWSELQQAVLKMENNVNYYERGHEDKGPTYKSLH